MPWLGLEIVFWVWYTRQANELNTAHDIIPEKTTWIRFVFFKIFTAMNSLNISYSPSFSFLFLSFHDLSCYSVSGLVGVENFFPVLLFFTFYFFLSSIFLAKRWMPLNEPEERRKARNLWRRNEWKDGCCCCSQKLPSLFSAAKVYIVALDWKWSYGFTGGHKNSSLCFFRASNGKRTMKKRSGKVEKLYFESFST